MLSKFKMVSFRGHKKVLAKSILNSDEYPRPFHMGFPPGAPQRRVPHLPSHPPPAKIVGIPGERFFNVFTLQLPTHLCVKTSSFPGFSPTRCVKSAQTTFYSYLIGIQLHVSLHRSQDSFWSWCRLADGYQPKLVHVCKQYSSVHRCGKVQHKLYKTVDISGQRVQWSCWSDSSCNWPDGPTI